MFCTLALLAKVTAGWAPLAILLYTFFRDRKTCLVFAAAWIISLVAVLGVLHVVTSGRMLASFTAFSEPPGAMLGLLLKSPFRLVRFLARSCPLFPVLIPFVVVELVRAAQQRRFTVYHCAFLTAIPVLLVILADRGTDFNHLVDLVVLGVILIGYLWASLGAWREGTSFPWPFSQAAVGKAVDSEQRLVPRQ